MSNHEHTHHGPGLPIYFGVFFALLILTALTVWAAFQDFGVLNTPIALAIAVVKATLVILFFMHVWYGTPLLKLFVVSGFFFLAIMTAFIAGDYLTRSWQTPTGW